MFVIDKEYALCPVGKPQFDMKYRVVDDDGNDVPDGEIGEFVFENPYVRGYINLPEETAKVFKDGYFYTADFVQVLPDGFLAIKFSDCFLIRMGLGIIAAGVALLFVPFHSAFALVGFVIIGLGCAPIDPCLIHMTPSVFGEEKSQAMIGVQTAFSYIGYLSMPTLFGLIVDYISVSLLPVFILGLLLLISVMHELVTKRKIISSNMAKLGDELM